MGLNIRSFIAGAALAVAASVGTASAALSVVTAPPTISATVDVAVFATSSTSGVVAVGNSVGTTLTSSDLALTPTTQLTIAGDIDLVAGVFETDTMNPFAFPVSLNLFDVTASTDVLSGTLTDAMINTSSVELLFDVMSGTLASSFPAGALVTITGFSDGLFLSEAMAFPFGIQGASLTIEAVAAPIPLPAALPLFVTALAGAGVIRRRRRAA